MLEVQGSDLLLSATFGTPLFAALNPERHAALAGALYERLARFGIRVHQMDVSSAPSIGGNLVRFPLFDFGLEVRLSATQLAVQNLNANRLGRGRLLEVASECEVAIRSCVSTASWSAANYEIRLHCKDSVRPWAEFVRPFIGRRPDRLGGLISEGVSFYFAAPPTEPDLGATMLLLEPSALFPEALYFRLQMTWAKIHSLGSIGPSAEQYFARAFGEVGLDLPQDLR